jgi:hypothetical protein
MLAVQVSQNNSSLMFVLVYANKKTQASALCEEAVIPGSTKDSVRKMPS